MLVPSIPLSLSGKERQREDRRGEQAPTSPGQKIHLLCLFFDINSAGVEIYPTPRGIMFSLLGFPGGINPKNNKQTNKQKKTKISKFPLTPTG